MSSLLDVLHKRPPRSQSPAAEAVQPAPRIDPPPADASMTARGPELRLAPDSDAGASPLHEAVLPSPDDPTLKMPHPGPATPADETTRARRWSDPLPPAQSPPAPVAAAPMKAPARPRRPVLVAIVVTTLAVLAAAGYLALQFTAPSEEGFLAAPADVTLPAAPPAVAGPDGATAAPARQAVVQAKKKRRPRPESAVDVAPVAADGGETPWYDQPALPAEAAAADAPVIQITRGSTRNPLFEKLRDAYAALLSGDNARSESLYREVIAADPANADALLGLGSLAARGGRTEEARDLFRQVQRLNPKNAAAAAALSALAGSSGQPGSESQLKGMLREQPNSASLHFALGLRYVEDQLWPDAQSSFFEAVRNDPTNADYAFNLAVSLDRLGQRQPAASYYQRALDLAAGSQQFDLEIVRARLAVLAGPRG